MVNPINEAIDSRRFVFAQSIAQSFAQNTPTCAHTPAFHPHSSAVSSCKHAPRKAWSGLWNRGSRVQIPSLTPKLLQPLALALLNRRLPECPGAEARQSCANCLRAALQCLRLRVGHLGCNYALNAISVHNARQGKRQNSVKGRREIPGPAIRNV